MSRSKTDIFGLVLLVASAAVALVVIPVLTVDPTFTVPTLVALIGAAIALGLLLLIRAGTLPRRLERPLLGLFLFSMPAVYLASARDAPAFASSWLPVELFGQLVFGALAVLGVKRSALWLAGGIAAHGLLWDSWHIGASLYTPDWYSRACLVLDVGWGLYVLTRLRAWRLTAAPVSRDDCHAAAVTPPQGSPPSSSPGAPPPPS